MNKKDSVTIWVSSIIGFALILYILNLREEVGMLRGKYRSVSDCMDWFGGRLEAIERATGTRVVHARIGPTWTPEAAMEAFLTAPSNSIIEFEPGTYLKFGGTIYTNKITRP